jgi:hypothetical protein
MLFRFRIIRLDYLYLYVLITSYGLSYLNSWSFEDHMYSPYFPTDEVVNSHRQDYNLSTNSSYDKLIPRNVWVAVREGQNVKGK